MQIDCIVIDDEPLAIEKMVSFIRQVPGLNLLRTFDNAILAMQWLKENPVDLVFLDIQMDQLTGIQLLEATGITARVIITSAYAQYALKGYELNVSDYLLKPFSFQRFLMAVNKVMDSFSGKSNSTRADEESRYIFVKTEYRLERVDVEDILYIEGMKDYLRIACTCKKIMTLQSFAKLEESLSQGKFCRVHKSYIVALNKIKSVERRIILIADQRIPISDTYKDNFFRRIQSDIP